MKVRFPEFFALLLFLGGADGLSAQPGNWNPDPTARAEQQTTMMVEKLVLSEAQAAKIREINLKYAQKMSESRTANPDGDREARRAAMQTLRGEQDVELKIMLTSDQWAAWEKIREEQRNTRRGGNPENGKKEGEKPSGGQ